MKNTSLKELQELVVKAMSLVPDSFTRTIYYDVSKLCEESGEVAQSINKSKFTVEDQAEELCDVIFTCLWIGHRLGIENLDEVFINKFEKKVERFLEKWHSEVAAEAAAS